MGRRRLKNAFDYLNDVKMDLDMYEHENMSEKEIKEVSKMVNGKKRSFKKIVAVAACAAVVAAAGTAIASGYAGEIVRMFSTGHNTFIQMDPDVIPEELKGMIFDEDGNAVTVMDEGETYYDKDGNVLNAEGYAKILNDAYGEDIAVNIADEKKTNEKVFESMDEAIKAAAFDIKLPSYIPEGWEISKIYTYADDEGAFSGDYISIEYKNGDKDMTIMERLINENTSFTYSTDGDMEEIDLNGKKAVISNGRNLDFETGDGVSVSVHSMGNVTKDELVKIAESVE